MGFGRKKAYLKKFLILVFIIGLLTSGSYFGYRSYLKIISNMQLTYEDEIETLQVEKYMKKRMVYMPKESVAKGEILNQALVELKEIHSNLDQELFATSDDFGKQLITSHTQGMPIFKNTLAETRVNDDHRIRELSTVLLQSDLTVNEVVDCRIRYANGLEFIVLSKKKIEKIDLSNNTIWLSLNEKESLLLSSALVDKAYFQGSSFYISRYIESNIQKEALVNYLPNAEVIALIEEELSPQASYSTEEKEKRIALEEILYVLDEEQTAQVEESVENEVTSVNKRVSNQDVSNIEITDEVPIEETEETYDFN